MADLSQPTKKLISRYQIWHQSLQKKEEIPVLHVDEVASKVAAFYEKIRGVIEWREEHLLRKTAIERILKRRLLLTKEGEKIALPFVLELIRGGHFPNDTIEESKVKEIQRIIDKYIFILKNKPDGAEKKKSQTRARLGAGPTPHRNEVSGTGLQPYNWLLGIAACEVEECLSYPLKENALIEYMTDIMKERIVVKEGAIVIGGIKETEKNTQIYIACQRALFKMDPSLISFHLLEQKFSNWSSLTQEELKELAQNIYSIKEGVEMDLAHPLSEKFYSICERYDTPYLILGDIISQNQEKAAEVLSNPEELEGLITQTYQQRLQRLKEKIKRAAIYSTISIFVTKILLVLAVEAPFDKYVTGQFDYLTLGLNVFIPPLIMMVIIATIRPPTQENLQKVIMEFMKITQEIERKETYQIKALHKMGFIMKSALLVFYLLSFIISFGIIIWGLQKLNFGIPSILIFLFFISLILFASTKIRQRARELHVGDEKESILTSIFDFLTLPLVRVGRFISKQWERYNILIVLLNILIELPFQLFTEFLEQWRYFLKEKKEEIH